MIDLTRLIRAHQRARSDLLAQQTPDGHWEGQLASSALATATALSALALADSVQHDAAAQQPRSADSAPFPQAPSPQAPSPQAPSPQTHAQLIDGGLRYLQGQQQSDGGWGDTDKSYSNIATTMLVQAAVTLANRRASGRRVDWQPRLEGAERYIEGSGGVTGLRKRYGKDKTFAVPILANAALAGLVDWRDVAALPFELACVPQRFFRWVRMPVVSYAVPALVAIGQARYAHRRPRWFPLRWLRRAMIGRSLRVLRQMQPDSGGYLEAVPLTSFVVMSLLSTIKELGRRDHSDRVVQAGLAFLCQSVRDDGSWPIDTNLATWMTSLSTSALATGRDRELRIASTPTVTMGSDSPEQADAVALGHARSSAEEPQAILQPAGLRWLLQCQHRQRHPYTGAAPGGWGWTDLSGAVPDADDTAAALLALADVRDGGQTDDLPAGYLESAVRAGVNWLLDLQNRDGGWPTFCRGWGKLPFDRSGSDLTAHALRALQRWRPAAVADRIDRASARGWRYLERTQRADGSWLPLWFGNQDHPAEENPVYGTARVLLAYFQLGHGETPAAQRGCQWLESVQNEDGGWSGAGRCGQERPRSDTQRSAVAGGEGERRAVLVSQVEVASRSVFASSVEETALALEALLAIDSAATARPAVDRGLTWLCQAVLENRHRETSPIGFYFAKLWYYESLYPLTFTVAALGSAVGRRTATRAGQTTHTQEQDAVAGPDRGPPEIPRPDGR